MQVKATEGEFLMFHREETQEMPLIYCDEKNEEISFIRQWENWKLIQYVHWHRTAGNLSWSREKKRTIFCWNSKSRTSEMTLHFLWRQTTVLFTCAWLYSVELRFRFDHLHKFRLHAILKIPRCSAAIKHARLHINQSYRGDTDTYQIR